MFAVFMIEMKVLKVARSCPEGTLLSYSRWCRKNWITAVFFWAICYNRLFFGLFALYFPIYLLELSDQFEELSCMNRASLCARQNSSFWGIRVVCLTPRRTERRGCKTTSPELCQPTSCLLPPSFSFPLSLALGQPLSATVLLSLPLCVLKPDLWRKRRAVELLSRSVSHS